MSFSGLGGRSAVVEPGDRPPSDCSELDEAWLAPAGWRQGAKMENQMDKKSNKKRNLNSAVVNWTGYMRRRKGV